MGQYWYPVNLTKKETFSPHKIGNGLKLREQQDGDGVAGALHALLVAAPGPRGGGDYRGHWGDVVGRWAGDVVVMIGDYTEPGDLPQSVEICGVPCEHLYGVASRASHPEDRSRFESHDDEERQLLAWADLWTDISDKVGEFLELHGEFTLTGTGWRQRKFDE